MGRTSIKNKLILCFLSLILLVMIVVTAVNLTTNQFYIAQAVSTALALAAGIFFGGLFSNSLVQRLNRLSQSAELISSGDLTRDIQLASRDEVRNLEEIFSEMVNHIRTMIREMMEIYGSIGQAHGTLQQLSRNLAVQGESIDKSAKAIAEGSENQSMIVQKTVLRMENTIQMMDRLIHQSAQTVIKLSEAIHKTEKGEVRARETLGHLDQVLNRMAGQMGPIHQLSGKVEKIKMIIGVMDGIAQKTDLLSLNASIEATRAGEYGKGFALVAEEIRQMAESSKKSSGRITALVEDILEDNQSVVTLLTENHSEIGKGRKAISGIIDTLAEMLSGVGEAFAEVNQTEEITQKQMAEMKLSAGAFEELSRLANENFLSAQKTTLATERQKKVTRKMVLAMNSLEDLSRQMLASQRRFRLPEAP